MTTEPLEERLKYWHFHCCNCGCFIDKFLKENKHLDKVYVCPDCKEKIMVKIGLNITLAEVMNGKGQIILINCLFKL